MSRSCTVCTHSLCEEIDGELVAGTPFRNIAERFGCSTTALFRHKNEHLPAHLVKAQEVQESVRADGLLNRLKTLNQTTQDILREAREEKNNELALKAVARAERQLELEARLLGELNDQATVNILIAPEWITVRTAIMESLVRHPEARAEVAAQLMRLEGRR